MLHSLLVGRTPKAFGAGSEDDAQEAVFEVIEAVPLDSFYRLFLVEVFGSRRLIFKLPHEQGCFSHQVLVALSLLYCLSSETCSCSCVMPWSL